MNWFCEKLKAIVPIVCASGALILSGCAGIPESPRELDEGRAEAERLRGMDSSKLYMDIPKGIEGKVPTSLTLLELYTELDFDPSGDSLYFVSMKDPFGAIYASEIRDESVALTGKLYPGIEAVDNEADAFRHAYFSFRLSQKIGSERAKKFTDAYEISYLNKMGGRCMDLWNNREGRKMYEDTKTSKSDKKALAQESVMSAIKDGKLVLRPFEINWGEEKKADQQK